MNKINKHLANPTKNMREKTSINKIEMKGEVTTDFSEMNRIIGE